MALVVGGGGHGGGSGGGGDGPVVMTLFRCFVCQDAPALHRRQRPHNRPFVSTDFQASQRPRPRPRASSASSDAFITRARARGFRCFCDLRLSNMHDIIGLLLLLLVIGVLGLDLFLDREARSTA